MLCSELHWQDYPPALRNQITKIFMPASVTTPGVPQQTPLVQTAQIVALQPTITQLPLTVPMDVKQQQSNTSTAQLDKHGQPIQKPAWHEHSIKEKLNNKKKWSITKPC
uniref:Uncharacterized protein n=1 Tax=Romanomermis culicivorax TaxID=13658 RepID=A0A915HZW1_ROMCU